MDVQISLIGDPGFPQDFPQLWKASSRPGRWKGGGVYRVCGVRSSLLAELVGKHGVLATLLAKWQVET
jgi:hypothetical protein